MRDHVHNPALGAAALVRAAHRGIGRAFGARGRTRLPACLTAMLVLTACGGKSTDLVLNGVPANTNLHEASSLPAESVRTVARRDYGWRLIYHPNRAPADAEQGAARALCGLEGRRPARIDHIPRIDPYSDPGARVIDIHCA